MKFEQASFKDSNNLEKTNNFFVFLFSFFVVVVPFFILWILSCDFDLLNLQWIIPIGKKMDDGLLNKNLIINNNIFYVCLGISFFSILLFVLLKLFTKKINFDLLPFLAIFNILGWSTILTSMIPYEENNFLYIIIARIVIVLISMGISFLLFNKLSFILIIKFGNPYAFVSAYEKDEKEFHELKKEAENLRKIKKRDETYIDIVEEK